MATLNEVLDQIEERGVLKQYPYDSQSAWRRRGIPTLRERWGEVVLENLTPGDRSSFKRSELYPGWEFQLLIFMLTRAVEHGIIKRNPLSLRHVQGIFA